MMDALGECVLCTNVMLRGRYHEDFMVKVCKTKKYFWMLKFPPF